MEGLQQRLQPLSDPNSSLSPPGEPLIPSATCFGVLSKGHGTRYHDDTIPCITHEQGEDASVDQGTVLVRNAQRALGMRKRAAAEGRVFSADATTPSAWLQEMWSLFGDERRLIGAHERTLLMLRALRQAAPEDEGILSATPGTAKLLGAFVSRYAGVPAFDALFEGAVAPKLEAFPPGEAAALRAVSWYLQQCRAAGLIEAGSAAAQLAEKLPAPALRVQAVEPLFTAPAISVLLETCGAAQPKEARVQPLADGVQAWFVFTAGSTPVVRAVKEEVEFAVADALSAVEAPRIVVLAPDPLALFNALAPVFAAEGIASACMARVPFSRTWTGRALKAAAQLGHGDAAWRTAVTDLAYNPLSGMALGDAERLNAHMRADSLMQETEGAALLAEASPACAAFIRLAGEPSLAVAEEVAALMAAARLAPADRIQEAAAADALVRVVGSADELDASALALDVLAGVSVSVAEEAAVDGSVRARVEFVPMDAMDSIAEGSADAVIFADMTKDAFAIPAAKPATDALAERLGILSARDRHVELRAAFAVAEAAARRRVTCIVSLRDASGGQSYPSFLYDEFVEAVAQGDAFSADADGLFKVPACAREGFRVMDESDVVSGFGQTFIEAEEALALEPPVRGRLQALPWRSFMKMSAVKPGLPLLSASQLELYAHCPYQWFVARKVGVRGLDEELDSLHAGTFAHEVFRRTFDALAERGITRITEQNVEEAQMVAAKAFDALEQEQRAADPGDRCVASTLPDALRLHKMKEQIASALSYMQGLPSSFAVSASEFKIEPDEGVEYAGAVINGSVDRVDVSEEGRFAVLDYKGSTANHAAGCGKEAQDELPRKVQALIYAQSLPRTKAYAGMACAGALYLGYRAKEQKKFAAGSFDVGAYDARSVTEGNKSCVSMDFQAFLALVEERLEEQVQRMLAGGIAPSPRPGACAYCPCTFCDARMAK